MEMKKEKHRKRFCWSKLLCLCLALFLILKLGQQFQRYQAIQAEVDIYRQKLAEAEQEYQRQQEQLALYYNDSYLEQVARSSLGMVKMGEVVVSAAKISDVRELNEDIKDNDVIH